MFTYRMFASDNKPKPVRRVWECLLCTEEEYTGPRYRVETHLIRDHFTDQADAPYFCNLCKFTCMTEKELERHTDHYRPHTVLKEEAIRCGEQKPDRSYFITNLNPKKLTPGKHLKQLSREESILRSAAKKVKVELPLPVQANDIVSIPCSTYVPSFCPPSQTLDLPELTAETVIQVLEEESTKTILEENKVISKKTVTTSTEYDNLLVTIPSVTPVTDVLLPPLGSPEAISTPLASPVRRIIQQDALLSMQSSPEETNILPQLLENQQTHPADEWNFVPTASPYDQDTISSSSSSSSSCHSAAHLALLSDFRKNQEETNKQIQTLLTICTTTSSRVEHLTAETKVLKAQITGLRSLVRQQNEKLDRLTRNHTIQNPSAIRPPSRPFRPVHHPNSRRSATPMPSPVKKRKMSLKSVVSIKKARPSPKK